MERRGVAPIVATVLIIMITVVAATLIAVFVIPFIDDKLGEGKTCFETLGDLEIYDSDYNCYFESISGENRTGFSINVKGDKISGFKVVLVDSGNADSIGITNGTADGRIRMLGKSFSEALDFPELGGVRTYVYKGRAKVVEIYPVTNENEQCDLSDRIDLTECRNQEVIDSLFVY